MAKRKKAEPSIAYKEHFDMPQKTRQAIAAIAFIVIAAFLSLAAFNAAGPVGTSTHEAIVYLVGVGYFLLPVLFFTLAAITLREEKPGFHALKAFASALFILSSLSLVDITLGNGGLVGDILGKAALHYFDFSASLILLAGLCLISILILLEGTLSLDPLSRGWAGARGLGARFKKERTYEEEPEDNHVSPTPQPEEDVETESLITKPPVQKERPVPAVPNTANLLKSLLGTYTPPPLSLLERDKGRPGVGDIKGNANIIKRTLQNFGIIVELDEISIGPSVTRYAIKPAEGVRLQKIVSLQPNLELALAASPVRIEAPIPGKSLVGIEVPNHSKVTVGLGTILGAEEFTSSHKPLLVALGRDIAGNSHYGNISKMPHALIAGATGSGKSVTIHALITSLLYRCGPQQMRFIMIDPKRVELTLYNRLPHLLSPVITDAKRAIMALRWAGKEMERRYNILEQERVRDIESYHRNILTPALEKLRSGKEASEGESVPDPMPYIIIVIDELADIMQTFPRELEATIVRLAQMSRAVGIHLILSTQRPSVNVITGLIKANIPARIALQVASQIDSRTILDQAGAEKLLGAGDMLYLSADMGKPVRLQSAFISENEVKKVTDFIAKHNDAEVPTDMGFSGQAAGSENYIANSNAFSGSMDDGEEIDDDLYEAAKGAVTEAGKASTSYLQRKLRIGYARAARLMDVLEERGVIGPQDGAKPREIVGGRAPDTSESNAQ